MESIRFTLSIILVLVSSIFGLLIGFLFMFAKLQKSINELKKIPYRTSVEGGFGR